MPLTLPVRVYDVCTGTSAEDVNKRVLVSCRGAKEAQALVATLEQMKRGFVPADEGQYFAIASDVDLDLDVASVAEAVAQGYVVRSVVLASADIPQGKVIATVAGDDITATPGGI